MALGGGNFVVQNKILPGSYINVVSARSANATLGDRGVVAIAINADVNLPVGEVVEVSAEDFYRNTVEIFGCNIKDEKLKGLRDLYKNARIGYLYKLGGSGTPAEFASNDFCSAKLAGLSGNELAVSVHKSEEEIQLIVKKNDEEVCNMTLSTIEELNEANTWVTIKSDYVVPEAENFVPLSGGTSAIAGKDHQDFLNKIESYQFNALGCLSDDDTTKKLYAEFTRRMNDEVGVKFQLVVHNLAADSMNVINVVNDAKEGNVTDIIYWVLGAAGACAVNKSNTNKVYDGEVEINVDYVQKELENCILEGKFVLHRVGKEIRVLEDINSLVTETEDMGKVFKKNQCVRVVHQICNDIAVIFNNKYIGNVPNDNAGRVSLWNDIVVHHRALNDIRAIENFVDSDVVVEPGNDKDSVVVTDAITVINAFSKMYMTLTVR